MVYYSYREITFGNQGQDLTPREQFAGMVRYADVLIGRLIRALDVLGLRDNTIVFIMADNGTDNGTDQGDIQSLGGRVSIRSTPGEGAALTMTLPLTLAVMDGMIVEAKLVGECLDVLLILGGLEGARGGILIHINLLWRRW